MNIIDEIETAEGRIGFGEVTVCGARICYGAGAEILDLPIVNLPAGAIRVRRRVKNEDFAKFFVKTSDGIRTYICQFNEDRTGIELAYEQEGIRRENI